MIMSLKQRKIKFEPRMKLNHNTPIQSSVLSMRLYVGSCSCWQPSKGNIPVKMTFRKPACILASNSNQNTHWISHGWVLGLIKGTAHSTFSVKTSRHKPVGRGVQQIRWHPPPPPPDEPWKSAPCKKKIISINK